MTQADCDARPATIHGQPHQTFPFDGDRSGVAETCAYPGDATHTHNAPPTTHPHTYYPFNRPGGACQHTHAENVSLDGSGNPVVSGHTHWGGRLVPAADPARPPARPAAEPVPPRRYRLSHQQSRAPPQPRHRRRRDRRPVRVGTQPRSAVARPAVPGLLGGADRTRTSATTGTCGTSRSWSTGRGPPRRGPRLRAGRGWPRTRTVATAPPPPETSGGSDTRPTATRSPTCGGGRSASSSATRSCRDSTSTAPRPARPTIRRSLIVCPGLADDQTQAFTSHNSSGDNATVEVVGCDPAGTECEPRARRARPRVCLRGRPSAGP